MAGIDNSHFIHSSLREKILEHLFIGEVLKSLWKRNISDIEVLKAEVDNGGYDAVVSCQGVTRHIQLKASYAGSSTKEQKINISLCNKPSGCVIWMSFSPDTLDLGPFYWFGAEPGKPLPSICDFKVAKHNKGNSTGQKLERPNIRVLRRSAFSKLSTIEEVIFHLFGVSK